VEHLLIHRDFTYHGTVYNVDSIQIFNWIKLVQDMALVNVVMNLLVP
jgi:hypothetical protein